MLTESIQAALRQAHYELEDGTFYGEIPGFAGIVASGETQTGASLRHFDGASLQLVPGQAGNRFKANQVIEATRARVANSRQRQFQT